MVQLLTVSNYEYRSGCGCILFCVKAVGTRAYCIVTDAVIQMVQLNTAFLLWLS